uniref:Methyltransferase domain-containing protein n=2 Tax=Acidithiobacillus ferrianus TaxID=2678518 RepID=A0A845U5E6_9PROT|nr:methyltransferase domain-containing protein [Acidithiobacillus ferrianus]
MRCLRIPDEPDIRCCVLLWCIFEVRPEAFNMFDFSQMLHDERTRCLRSLPKFSGTVLSAGCAGTWYFNWFEDCTGHSGKHIGIELYSEKPPDLPENVEWTANSVGDMRDVDSASVAVVFSGQNIEHLIPKDVAGFLLESNRVLKNEGLLVIDSPNRSSTQHLGWAQPEHTLEFTADEMVSLLDAAGFDVMETRGIWLVRDPVTKRPFDLFSCQEGELDSDERRYMARLHAEDSFIWWINAKKHRSADTEKVVKLVSDIFFRNYDSFVNARFVSHSGVKGWEWGASVVTVHPEDSGCVLNGPYIPLSDGNYQAIFHIRNETEPVADGVEIVLEVVSAFGDVIHGKRVIGFGELKKIKGWTEFSVDFGVVGYVTAVETKVMVKNYSGSVLAHVNILKE